jgi:hypothetical protein
MPISWQAQILTTCRRYYYAVMVLSSKSAAKEVYDKTDGTELLSSSNHLDLRFIPDDVTFDDEPRDKCSSVPVGYKPVEFTTRALNHSKVELTWDMDPEASRRTETMRKAFTGSRNDINENDLRAYLGSDSSDAESEPKVELDTEEQPLSKKELARRKMRAALGLSDEPSKTTKAGPGPVGEMQITFTPALTEKESKKNDNTDETTLEKYRRKEKERKAKKKEQALSRREGHSPEVEVEDVADEQQQDDMGFDDPFFTTENPAKTSRSSVRKEERLKKRAARELEEAENAAERAKLELLMADDGNEGGEHLKHFDNREIERERKLKGKKGKRGKKVDDDGLQEDVRFDVDDPRFQDLLGKPEFAIDPSHPKFKATPGMKKVMEISRKKRKQGPEIEEEEAEKPKKSKKAKEGDLHGLVEAVKKKARRK